MLQNTKSMQELNIVQIIEEILASLENLLSRFRSKIDDFPLVQYDHFNSVRRMIDIKRETLLDEILRAKTNENTNTNSNSRLDSNLEHSMESWGYFQCHRNQHCHNSYHPDLSSILFHTYFLTRYFCRDIPAESNQDKFLVFVLLNL